MRLLFWKPQGSGPVQKSWTEALSALATVTVAWIRRRVWRPVVQGIATVTVAWVRRRLWRPALQAVATITATWLRRRTWAPRFTAPAIITVAYVRRRTMAVVAAALATIGVTWSTGGGPPPTPTPEAVPLGGFWLPTDIEDGETRRRKRKKYLETVLAWMRQFLAPPQEAVLIEQPEPHIELRSSPLKPELKVARQERVRWHGPLVRREREVLDISGLVLMIAALEGLEANGVASRG